MRMLFVFHIYKYIMNAVNRILNAKEAKNTALQFNDGIEWMKTTTKSTNGDDYYKKSIKNTVYFR